MSMWPAQSLVTTCIPVQWASAGRVNAGTYVGSKRKKKSISSDRNNEFTCVFFKWKKKGKNNHMTNADKNAGSLFNLPRLRELMHSSLSFAKHGEKTVNQLFHITLLCHLFVLTTFWRHVWSTTKQAHGKMESICWAGSIFCFDSKTNWVEDRVSKEANLPLLLKYAFCLLLLQGLCSRFGLQSSWLQWWPLSLHTLFLTWPVLWL